MRARALWVGLMLWSLSAWAAPPRIALRWKAVTGAVAYELEIAKDASFRQVVLRERTPVSGYRWNELPNANHYWRVRSVDTDGRVGEWSRVEIIPSQVGAPRLASPRAAHVATLRAGVAEVPLEVQPSPVLKTFSFEVAADAEFRTDRRVESADKPVVRMKFDRPGVFHWRARAVDVAGRPTDVSETRTVDVRLPAPAPTAPEDGAQVAVGAVGLRWEAEAQAEAYVVQRVCDGAELPTLKVSHPNAEWAIGSAGKCSFKVAAVDVLGRQTSFGVARSFTVALEPASGLTPPTGKTLRIPALSDQVELAWQLPRGATIAEVELSRDDFKSVHSSKRVEGERLALALPADGAWSWRVVAKDARGNRAPPSPSSALTVRLDIPLSAPLALAPAQDAVLPTNAKVALQWAPVPLASAYELELDSETHRIERTGAELAAAEGEHRWRVRAIDDLGAPGAWSAEARFHAGVPQTTRAEVALDRDALVADGEEESAVRIALYDARGRQVAGSRPEVAATHGRVEDVQVVEGRVVARFVAPDALPDGEVAQLVVRDRSFESRTPIRLLKRPNALFLGASAGYSTAFSALSSPYAGAFLTWNTPYLRERLALSLRGGYFAGEIWVRSDAAGEVKVSAGVVPLTALAMYRAPLGPLELNAGAGVSVHLVTFATGRQAEDATAAGPAAAVELLRAAGPGNLSVGVMGEWTSVDGDLARARTGGLRASLGCGVRL